MAAAPIRTRRTQAERSSEARTILIEVAIQHIREKGLAYVTMAEVADEAGMTRGAIHHHFGSRDEYMRAVLTALTDRVAAVLADIPVSKEAPNKRLRYSVEQLGRVLLSREQLAVTDISISSRSVPLLFADSQATSQRMRKIYAAAWERLLKDDYPAAAIRRGFLTFSTFCSGMLVINYGEPDPRKHGDMLSFCADLVEASLKM